MHLSEKTMAVMGEPRAGKKTITGCLVYKVGHTFIALAIPYELTVCHQCSFDLDQLGHWERSNLSRYEEIPPFYEDRNDEASCCFYAPGGPVTVQCMDVIFILLPFCSFQIRFCLTNTCHKPVQTHQHQITSFGSWMSLRQTKGRRLVSR